MTAPLPAIGDAELADLQAAAGRVIAMLGDRSQSARVIRRLSAIARALWCELIAQGEEIQETWLCPAEREDWQREIHRLQIRQAEIAEAWREVDGASHRAYDAYLVPIELYEALGAAMNGSEDG